MYNIYKVVTKRKDNKLYSYNIHISLNEKTQHELLYDINLITKPTVANSLLFAFLDKKEAFKMIDMNYSTFSEVYRAETPWYVTGVIPQNTMDYGDIYSFWNNYTSPADSYTKNRHRYMEQFKSSICCPSIRLIEKVDR